jgi:uncharacterized protein
MDFPVNQCIEVQPRNRLLAELRDKKPTDGMPRIQLFAECQPKELPYGIGSSTYETDFSLAKDGDAMAQCRLGFRYARGLGVQQNYARAIAYFESAAESVPQALCELGKLHALGLGEAKHYEAKRDCELAYDYFLGAHKNGVPEASCELGKMYFYGWGVEEDHEEAFALFEHAANYDVPEACFFLGKLNFNDDKRLAIEQGEKAGMLGCAEAFDFLGLISERHEGVAGLVSPDLPLDYYKRGAELGSPGALYKVGQHYLQIGKHSDAVDCFEKGALEGYGESYHMLGHSYVYGCGVKRNDDEAKALACFIRGAQLGVARLWEKLDEIEHSQINVNRNIKEEAYYKDVPYHPVLSYKNEYGKPYANLHCFFDKKLAENPKDTRALQNKGMLCWEGRGVEKNPVIAMQYLDQAVQLGDPYAKLLKENIELFGKHEGFIASQEESPCVLF